MDVEGSTRLLGELGAVGYREVLGEYRRVVREACARYDGYEVDAEGDAFFLAFASAPAAVAAVREALAALAGGPVRIRVGVHTGEPLVDPPKYVGLDVHRASRVMSAAHGGQVVLSAETVALLDPGSVELVALGSHRLKDFDEPVSLFQLGEGSFPPLRTLANTNLPTPVSSFVGRQDELADADQLLRATRLLTVTGPGGAGKTRFAVELAHRIREERFGDYPDGIYSCFLSSLRDAELVLPTIAHALSLREQGSRSALETLTSHLAGKRVLILLDNLEHLLACAARLSELVTQCPGLTLLCTSRELLRIGGEAAYELPPMPAEASVSLFCERARTEPTVAIEELCRRLDGLPLALELAAARTRLLTPEQLLERLAQRLDFLRGGRDVDPRQQTLRATIQWSYDLLTEDEQALFARLAVFVGGWTLEAAEAVCAADLDSFASLLDKSLVRRTDDESGPRYWMHELIREFAAEQLDLRGETEALRLGHAEYYLAFAERAEPELKGPEQEAWATQVEQQHANVTTAITFLSDTGKVEPALRIAGALARHWERRGHVAEGRALVEKALREASSVAPEVRAKAVFGAATLAYRQDDHDSERALLEEALALYRKCGDASGVLRTEMELVWMALSQGDSKLGMASAEHYVERARELDDGWVLAFALQLWGDVLTANSEFERARRAYKESAALFDAVGDSGAAFVAGSSIGWVAILAEDYEEAESILGEAIARDRGGDSGLFAAVHRNNLGLAKLLLGRDEDAARELCVGLRLFAPMHAIRGVSESLLGLAAIAARASRVDVAARLRGASLALRDASGAPITLVEERIEERFLSGLDESARLAGELAGRSMTLDDALGDALELGESLQSNSAVTRPQ